MHGIDIGKSTTKSGVVKRSPQAEQYNPEQVNHHSIEIYWGEACKWTHIYTAKIWNQQATQTGASPGGGDGGPPC